MSIQVPTPLLTRLYDGAPTVVVISSEQRFRALLPGLPVQLLLAAADGTGQSVRLLGEMAPAADWQAITVPPSVWCIWVLDDSAGAAMEEGNSLLGRTLQDWWRKHGGDDVVPDLRTGSVAEFERYLLSHAVGEMTGLQRRMRDLLGSVSALRDELAHGTRIPPEITELLENLRLSPPRMIFANSPGKAGVTVPRLPGNGEAGGQGNPVPVLAQRLPVWARGLAGIDLHLANTPVGSGALLLSLHAVDAAKGLATWHIPYAELAPGWLPLRLPTLRCLAWFIGRLRPPPRSGKKRCCTLACTGLRMKQTSAISPGISCWSRCRRPVRRNLGSIQVNSRNWCFASFMI